MKYFFPGVLSVDKVHEGVSESVKFHVDSATNAIRLSLRFLKLNKGDKVAIPSFACSSVESAVIQEGLLPFKLDIKNDNSYWTEYDLEKIFSNKVKAVILVHLYGFVHPNTEKIIALAREKNIFLVHDLAQSYGINKNRIMGEEIKIYSFGPGKSTVAALGGYIEGIAGDFFKANTVVVKPYSLQNYFINQRARFFIKRRTYNYKFSICEKLFEKIINKIHYHFFYSGQIKIMTSYQLNAADYVIKNLERINSERKTRYLILKEAMVNHVDLTVAYDDNQGLYFKTVIFCKSNPEDFAKYLETQEIPYFRLFDNAWKNLSEKTDNRINFKTNANKFFEISSESSLPMEEVKRIAHLLALYKK